MIIIKVMDELTTAFEAAAIVSASSLLIYCGGIFPSEVY